MVVFMLRPCPSSIKMYSGFLPARASTTGSDAEARTAEEGRSGSRGLPMPGATGTKNAWTREQETKLVKARSFIFPVEEIRLFVGLRERQEGS